MKKYFFTGLAIFLPLLLTLWIVSVLVNVLTGPFSGITQKIFEISGLFQEDSFAARHTQMFAIFDKLVILGVIFGGILFVGAIGRHFIFSYLIQVADAVLAKIPIIRSIYTTSRELIQTIFATNSQSFKKVVLVPFPHQDTYAIGLLTSEDTTESNTLTVFVPSSPNPTSGFLLLFERSQVMFIDLSVEEAFRYIISCGVLLKHTNLTKISNIP